MILKFIVLSCLLFNQVSWVNVVSDDGRFSVDIPSNINWIKTTNSFLSSIGQMELNIYKSNDKDQYGNSYLVSYVDYADYSELTESLKDSLILETELGLPGELIYKKDLKGINKRGFILRKKLDEQDLHLKSNIFFLEDRLYILLVYAPELKSLNSNVDTFLESFRSHQPELNTEE